MTVSSARFFVNELNDIYWAEKHIVSTLPKMAKAATLAELKEAFTAHVEEIKGHVSRLEDVFKTLGEKAVAKNARLWMALLKNGPVSSKLREAKAADQKLTSVAEDDINYSAGEETE